MVLWFVLWFVVGAVVCGLCCGSAQPCLVFQANACRWEKVNYLFVLKVSLLRVLQFDGKKLHLGAISLTLILNQNKSRTREDMRTIRQAKRWPHNDANMTECALVCQ